MTNVDNQMLKVKLVIFTIQQNLVIAKLINKINTIKSAVNVMNGNYLKNLMKVKLLITMKILKSLINLLMKFNNN
jgi:hypothetical protein